MSDAVVVETADAVMVSSRSRSQDLKRIVARLEADGRGEKNLHRKVHRPWGCTASTPDRASRSSASWSSRARH